MENNWLIIPAMALAWFLGWLMRSNICSHDHGSHSIPPSEPLDTQKRKERLAAGTEDVSAFHVRRSTLDRRCRKEPESGGTSLPHSGEKSP